MITGKKNSVIGTIVTVTVDRPSGSYHPEHKDMYYPVNYGYIEGIVAPDGEEQDAYILGVNKPVDTFTGRIIAVVHRKNDIEDKWVVVPDGMMFSRRQKECLSLPMSIPTKYIKIHPFKNICDVFDTTALKPQNLVQNTNSKTHLTNHCSGIRRGKILSEVVKATGSATNPHSHISIFYRIHQTVINHG